MILFFLPFFEIISAEVFDLTDRCPSVTWQKPGDSVVLKWGKNMETFGEGTLNVKLLIRKEYLQTTKSDFTLAVLFQRCLPENVTEFFSRFFPLKSDSLIGP